MTSADLRRACEVLGLSATGLAVAIGMSERSGGRTIRRYWSGKRPVPEVVELKVEKLLAARARDDEAAEPRMAPRPNHGKQS